MNMLGSALNSGQFLLEQPIFSDISDSANALFTSNVLIVLALISSYKQFGGRPIECLTPDSLPFIGADQYAENFCWAQDTYYVPMHSVVDGMPQTERRQRRISYYQWVPFFLLIEAACFRLPSLLWKYMSGQSGIKIHEIVKLSSDPNNIKPDIKRANIKSLAVHLQGALRFHRRLNRKQIRPHRLLRFFNLAYSASFVTVMYLLTKFSYLTNVFLQLYIMNKFLETDKYSFYGFGAIVDLLNGTTWEKSGVFPRVSLCDFEVRVMGNVQEHTIQCVLVINIFNEKIFVFLWFWYLCLLVFTLGSFLYWLMVMTMPFASRRFIKRHLELSEMPFDPDENEKEVQTFIDSYLHSDGIFVIRMLTLHSGVIFGTELVLSLWKEYFGIETQIKRSNSFPDLTASPIEEEKADYQNQDNSLRQRRRAGIEDMHPATKAQLANNLTERLLPAPSPNPSLVRVVASAFDSNPTTTPSNSSAGFHTASEGEASGGNAYGDYRAPAIVVPTAPTSGTATPRSVDSMASLPPLPPSPPKIREQKT